MSQNLHEALDAIEAALQSLDLDTGEGGAGETLQTIASNIDAIRVAIETQSVASIVAQNTNFSDLVGTLGILRLICSPTINVAQQNYFNPLQPDTTPGGDATPAPEPFEELEYDDLTKASRKCWIANVIVDEMRSFSQWVDDYNFDEITNIGYAALFSLWVALVGAWASQSAILAEVLATAPVLQGIVKYVFDNLGGVEASEIVTAIDARRDDMVCAIFEASDVSVARGDTVAILGQEGVSAVTQGWFLSVMADFYLNYAFYQFSEQVEAAYLAATAADFDCDSCNVVCGIVPNNTVVILSDTGTQVEVQAGQVYADLGDSAYYASFYISGTPDFLPCADTYTVSNFTITSGTVGGVGPVIYRLYSGAIPGGVGDLWHSNNPPPPTSGVRRITVKSVNPFNVRIDYVQD